MSTPLTDIVADIRLLSGLRSNQLYTDTDIASMASDCWLDLYDRFVTANQHYRVTSVDFTLAGGVGGNVFALPSAFQLGNGLEVDPDTQQPMSIPYLGSWLNRNYFGQSVFDATFPFCKTRRYVFNDSNLIIFPPQNASGNYRLWYTPQEKKLQAETVQSDVDIDAADVPFDYDDPDLGHVIAWNFANLVVPADLESGTLTVDLDAPNETWNGTYTVSGIVSGGSSIITTAPWPGISYTNPAAGTVSFTYQPTGTMSSLPDYASPWQLYIKLQTSIAIREARQQDVSDLNNRFQQQSLRVDRALQNRQEEATQPPLTRGTGGWWGW